MLRRVDPSYRGTLASILVKQMSLLALESSSSSCKSCKACKKSPNTLTSCYITSPLPTCQCHS
ncbi:hypothetical protein BDR03DRAFT_945170 [Suillus americanus]|nr:hypothetical protein BDR03DRAFT_945170 [Suillus americanus]